MFYVKVGTNFDILNFEVIQNSMIKNFNLNPEEF